MKQRKSRHEQQKQDKNFFSTYFKPIGFGLGIGVVVLILLLIIFSFLISLKDFSNGLLWPISLFCLSAGSFVTGFISSKMAQEHGLFYGFCCGLILCIFILICTILTHQSYLTTTGIYKFLCATIFSSLGGIIGVNQRKKRK